MVGTLGTNNQCIYNVCAILAENLKGRHHLRHLGFDEKIILKWGVKI